MYSVDVWRWRCHGNNMAAHHYVWKTVTFKHNYLYTGSNQNKMFVVKCCCQLASLCVYVCRCVCVRGCGCRCVFCTLLCLCHCFSVAVCRCGWFGLALKLLSDSHLTVYVYILITYACMYVRMFMDIYVYV